MEQLNVIDDILFRKMAEDVSFCEEVISTIMEQKITILEVTDQKDITNLQGRSVILDALCMDETGAVAENGLTEIYVNAAVDDGSDISKLMEIFTDNSKYDFEKFPKVSGRKQQFKIEEKGDVEVCTLVEEYAKEYAKEAVAEAIAKTSAETAAKTTIEAIDRMISALSLSIPEACRILGITVEKYNEYKTKSNPKPVCD